MKDSITPTEFNQEKNHPTLAHVKVSHFPSQYATEKMGDVTLSQLHQFIQSNIGLKQRVEKIRSSSDQAEIKKEKALLTPVTLSCQIMRPNGTRKGLKEREFLHSGIIQADVDEHPDFDGLFQQIQNDPHVAIAFRSPSNKVKVGFRIAPVPSTPKEHKAAFRAVLKYFNEHYDGTLDTNPSAVNSFCFLSFDPTACLNLEAIPIFYTYTPPPTRERRTDDLPQQDDRQVTELRSALNHIEPDEYETWIYVGMALYHSSIDSDLAKEIWDDWSQGSEKYGEDEIDSKWDSFETDNTETLDICFIFDVAQQNGWQAPPPNTDPPPHILFQHIPELCTVSVHAFSIPSTNGWQTGITHGRISAPNESKTCDQCGQPYDTPEINFGTLQAFYRCNNCGKDTPSSSYLQYELERTPQNAIISDFAGYIAEDPLLSEESLWGHGIFHLGASMGSGKTTLIYRRAREAAESGALTIIIVPRISLAQAVHAELREDTTLGWSLHYKGSERGKPKSERWRIGEYGCVTTIGMLPHLLKVIRQKYQNSTVRIFIDEIDFASSLLLSDIFKSMSLEIKQTLKAVIEAQGIVTAGQTASTLALEAIAKELNAPLKGYYTAPKIPDTTATLHIVDSHSTDQPKNRLTQAVIDQIRHLIENTNKNVYIFCDERRTAQIIASLFPEITLLYDRYHRDSPEARDLLRRKKLSDGKRIFISSNAIDVGISIEDENAETIVLSVLNPLTVGSYNSVVQRCMRNRQKPPLTIFLLNYQNALPQAPSEAIGHQTAHTDCLLNENEPLPTGLINIIGRQQGMNSLVDNQPADFIMHHLKQAGFSIQQETLDIELFDFEKVQARRKKIKDAEDEAVLSTAREILTPEAMLMESEIRQREWQDQQPAPINQLAHERANALLQECGWTGKVDRFVDEANTIAQDPTQAFENAGVTEEMWETACDAVGISPEKIKRWKRGYIPLHFPDAAAGEFLDSREYEPHHRHNYKLLAASLKSLLEKLPHQPTSKEAIGQALIDAAQANFSYEKLYTLMKDGTISPTIAKQVRFIPLGKDVVPTDRHFQFVKQFISEFYPARIAKVGNLYQLAAPKDTDAVEIFKQVIRCYVKHQHPGIDPNDPDNSDLTPPPAPPSFRAEKEIVTEGKRRGDSCREIAKATGMSKSWVSEKGKDVEKADPKAEIKARAVQMRGTGMTLQQIAEELNISDSTVHRWMSDPSRFVHANSNIRGLGGINMDKTGCVSGTVADSENRTRTVFEADPDTCNVNGSVKRSVKPISETILELLASGEKTTKDIVQAIDAKYNSITDELKRLVDAGEIQKPRRGRYILANTSAQAIPSETDTPAVTKGNPQHRIIIERPAIRAFRQAFPKTPMITTRSRTSDSEHWDELPAVAFIGKDDFLSGVGELDWMPVVYDSRHGVWRKTEWDEQLENPPAVLVRKPFNHHAATI